MIKGLEIGMQRDRDDALIDGLEAGIGYIVYFVTQSTDGKFCRSSMRISLRRWGAAGSGEITIEKMEAFSDASGLLWLLPE